jgi:hypothetical protein
MKPRYLTFTERCLLWLTLFGVSFYVAFALMVAESPEPVEPEAQPVVPAPVEPVEPEPVLPEPTPVMPEGESDLGLVDFTPHPPRPVQ